MLCGVPLPKRALSLREILIPLSFVAVELQQAFGIQADVLDVTASIETTNDTGAPMLAPTLVAAVRTMPGRRGKDPPSVPLGRIAKLMSALSGEYQASAKTKTSCSYVAKRRWPVTDYAQAQTALATDAFKFLNFGGHHLDASGSVHFSWLFRPEAPLIPTLSASLLLAFVLASLSRYRPHLLEKAENSRVDLLFEVFLNEANGTLIPALRNLLYGELLCLHRMPFT